MERILKVSGSLFTLILGEDMVPIEVVKSIVERSPALAKIILETLTLNNGINLIFISINMAIIVYENLFASWFMYLMTTYSGLKSIFKFIFKNPILGLFFLCTFYLRILAEGDKEKFNMVVSFFGMPKYEDVNALSFINATIGNVPRVLGETILGVEDTEAMSKIISDSTRMTIISKVSVKIVELFPVIIVVLYTIGKNRLVKEFNPVNVREFPDRKETEEVIEYIKEKGRYIKKECDKYKESCKNRIKTMSGCYCEGECDSTVMGGKKWCYVDEKKCGEKKKKLLRNFMGKSWDYCTGEEKRTCFTGKKYIVCPESVPKSPISKHKRTKKERILDRELATIGLIG